MDENRRLLFWEGASRKDFKSFPMEVQKDLGVALFVVQLGGTPPSAKPWKGLGSGVWELIEKRLKQLLGERGLGRRNG